MSTYTGPYMFYGFELTCHVTTDGEPFVVVAGAGDAAMARAAAKSCVEQGEVSVIDPSYLLDPDKTTVRVIYARDCRTDEERQNWQGEEQERLPVDGEETQS